MGEWTMKESEKDGAGLAGTSSKVGKQETIWRGRAFDFLCGQETLPNGKEASYGFIRHPGSAAVVPLFEDGSVMLIRQWRPPIRSFKSLQAPFCRRKTL